METLTKLLPLEAYKMGSFFFFLFLLKSKMGWMFWWPPLPPLNKIVHLRPKCNHEKIIFYSLKKMKTRGKFQKLPYKIVSL